MTAFLEELELLFFIKVINHIGNNPTATSTPSIMRCICIILQPNPLLTILLPESFKSQLHGKLKFKGYHEFKIHDFFINNGSSLMNTPHFFLNMCLSNL